MTKLTIKYGDFEEIYTLTVSTNSDGTLTVKSDNGEIDDILTPTEFARLIIDGGY